MRLFGKKKQKADSTMVLRGFPGDSSTNKCLLMAAEQGLSLETRLDVTEGACDGPEYRSLSPFGKVPCQKKNGDFVISGAPAILSYMGIIGKGGSLNPKKASILGEQNYWVDLAQRIGDPAVHTLIQPLVPGCENPSADAMEAARASLGPILDQLGALLADDRQFVAGQYSFADIHWTAIAHLCTLAGETGLVESRSNVSAWFDRIVERTSRSGGSSTYQALATLDEVRNKQLKSAA